MLDERAVGIKQQLRVIDRAAIALVDADGDDHASLLGGLADGPGGVRRYGHRLIEQFVVLRAHQVGRFDEGKIGLVGNDRFRESRELDALPPKFEDLLDDFADSTLATAENGLSCTAAALIIGIVAGPYQRVIGVVVAPPRHGSAGTRSALRDRLAME